MIMLTFLFFFMLRLNIWDDKYKLRGFEVWLIFIREQVWKKIKNKFSKQNCSVHAKRDAYKGNC